MANDWLAIVIINNIECTYQPNPLCMPLAIVRVKNPIIRVSKIKAICLIKKKKFWRSNSKSVGFGHHDELPFYGQKERGCYYLFRCTTTNFFPFQNSEVLLFGCGGWSAILYIYIYFVFPKAAPAAYGDS